MEEAPPDWDLLAVVRSCNTTSTTTTSTSTPLPQQQEHHPPLPTFSPTSAPTSPPHAALFRFPNPFEPPVAATTSFQELQEICNTPLICTTTTTTGAAATSTSCCVAASSATTSFQTAALASPVASSPFSIVGRSFSVDEQTVVRRPVKPAQVVFGAPSASTNAASSSQAQRTKKRKNLMKKVCHVPAEGLSSDMWAWRKYGQKPIKGSPYPRGYYRCSSSKGCLARKQVERNRSDPKMFIVTYTAEHNHPMPTHRNSLAGSTRQKALPSTAGETPAEQPTCSSPSALSPATEKNDADEAVKDEMEEDNEMGISDLMLNDDFYVEFEQIDGGDEGECFSDHFSPPMELPWLSSNSGTATAAGGS